MKDTEFLMIVFFMVPTVVVAASLAIILEKLNEILAAIKADKQVG